MAEFLFQIGLLLIIIAVIAILLRFVKQPPIVAYLLTGLIVSYFGFKPDTHVLELVAEIGIILLLFLAGLEVKLKEFLALGPKTLMVGEGHDFLMGALGFILAFFLLKVGVLASFYLAICLTLSSTIVVVKALNARKELEAPHGKILMGTMILQDIVAMVALAIFTSLDKGGSLPKTIGLTLGKAVLVFFIMYFLGKWVLPRVFMFAAQSVELIFILGLAWCFTGVIVAHFLSFSMEIGAFLAGMSISELPFSFEITDKARSLQDFGLLLFFVTVGLQVNISVATFTNWKLYALLGFVIVTTPIVTGLISSYLGFLKKETFLLSMMPVQVSEFSLVLIAIGKKLGHVSDELFTIVTVITIITIVLSSGVVANIGGIYKRLEHWLDFLEWKVVKKARDTEEKLEGHVVILGFGSLGESIARYFKKQRKKVVIVDWRPEVMKIAKKLQCKMLYGDAGDPDIWEQLRFDKAHAVISTIGNNQDDDINIIRWLKKRKFQGIAVGETNFPWEVKQLYKAGYDFVLVQDDAEWLVLQDYLKRSPAQRRSMSRKLHDMMMQKHYKEERGGYAARQGL